MEPINGTYEPKSFVNGLNGHATEAKPVAASEEPPAKTIPVGRVLTRIWANPTVWGEITWRITQIRTGSEARGAGEYRSLHLDDLWDGIRGLYQAHRWIRRVERRRHRRWFWGW